MQQLTPSATVRTRGRRFIVMDVTEHGECRSVRLSSAQGEEAPITLLHPYDRLQVVPGRSTPRFAGRNRVARCCAHAVRTSYAAGETRSVIDARIEVYPYQIEPALAVLRGDATRILLADEVGLGKTVQAGLVLSELRARQALRRALVLTPAGLRDQWGAELRDRFHFDVSVLDAGELGVLQRTLPARINPWSIPGLDIASIDLLKRRELLPQLESVIWDAVIVDEAHHATRGTDRHAAASLVCARARVVVLITATPHSGDPAAFDDLCSIGSLGEGQPIQVFRRTREDVWSGAPARRTRVVRVPRSEAERRLDARLRAYTLRVWRESTSEAKAHTGARLAMIVLRKRALSGPASLARSLARRLAALEPTEPAAVEAQLALDFQDSLGGELIEDDHEPAAELGTPGLADGRAERAIVSELLERARLAVRFDSKGGRLIAAVSATREPLIIFTEYRDTLEDLRHRLAGHVSVVLLHGAMLPGERRDAIAAFESGRARVLLATDAAAEGLNLHRRCRWVIHHEVPWSPVRIEQRNGRVDRLGQRRRVHVWHLIAAATEEEDVLERLARRSAVAARELHDSSAVASAVFEGAALSVGDSAARIPSVAAPAADEAARVRVLRRLPRATVPEASPLCDRAFRPGRPVLAVFRLMVVDALGRSVANESIAIAGPDLETCQGVANTEAGKRSDRSIAWDRHWAQSVRRRSGALRSALSLAADGPVQASLFDRRALEVSEHRRTERRLALSELTTIPDSLEPYAVQLSLVGALARRDVP